MMVKICTEDSHGHVQSLARADILTALSISALEELYKVFHNKPEQALLVQRHRRDPGRCQCGLCLSPLRWHRPGQPQAEPPGTLHHLPGAVGFARVRILGHHPEASKTPQKPKRGQDATERCFGIAVPQQRPLSGPKCTLCQTTSGVPAALAPLICSPASARRL